MERWLKIGNLGGDEKQEINFTSSTTHALRLRYSKVYKFNKQKHPRCRYFMSTLLTIEFVLFNWNTANTPIMRRYQENVTGFKLLKNNLDNLPKMQAWKCITPVATSLISLRPATFVYFAPKDPPCTCSFSLNNQAILDEIIYRACVYVDISVSRERVTIVSRKWSDFFFTDNLINKLLIRVI